MIYKKDLNRKEMNNTGKAEEHHFLSVVMPVYNGAETLQEAIESILEQTYTQFELIIGDDGSTDDSWNIIRKQTDTRIRAFRNQENKGLIATLNEGIRVATGSLIARMDQDDIALPRRFEKQVKFMLDNPHIGISGTLIQRFGALEDRPDFPCNEEEVNTAFFFFNPISHPTAMIRSSVLREFKLTYNKDYIHAEDYQLFWEISRKSSAANYPEVLLNYRVHPSQITRKSHDTVRNTTCKLWKDMWAVLDVEPTQKNSEAWAEWLLDNKAQCNSGFYRMVNTLALKNEEKKVFPPALFNRKLASIFKRNLQQATRLNPVVFWYYWTSPLKPYMKMAFRELLYIHSKMI
jgi:glycosyltransferase involved in cell wall biosynthesis